MNSLINKALLTLSLISGLIVTGFSQDKISNSGSVKFQSLSKKDVKAECVSLTSKINLSEKTIVVSVPIQGFEFKQSVMQKHFNSDKNMDSQQFPKAKFKGTITSEKRLSKDGVYKTSVNGQMTIKGISKPLTAEGTIEIVNDKVIIISTFIIKGNEFGLETKYAKEIEVTINTTY